MPWRYKANGGRSLGLSLGVARLGDPSDYATGEKSDAIKAVEKSPRR